MSPNLVAGAWAGFNDNRVTMGDSWGQGAHSALPMVGEVFQQAIKVKLVDPALRFGAPPQDPASPDALGKMNDWFRNLFEQREAAQAPVAPPESALPDVAQPQPQPDLAQPRPASGSASVETIVIPAPVPVPQEIQRSEIVRVVPGAASPGAAPQGATGSASGNSSFEVQPARPVVRQLEAPEPAPQPARGSASVRFEPAPEPAAEPAR
jgi:penicillin-binding protein 1A